MKPEWKYLTPNDETTVLGLIKEWMPRFAPSAAMHLYHYTTGDNLIRIIESGKLWSTQITCLNDTAEVRYAVEELHRRVRARRAGGAPIVHRSSVASSRRSPIEFPAGDSAVVHCM